MKTSMNKLIAVSALAAVLVTTNSYADTTGDEVRKTGIFLVSGIAGAILGGPIGMLAAPIGSLWFDETLQQAGRVDESELALDAASETIESLQARLIAEQQTSDRYAQQVLDQLQLELLFRTGASELSEAGKTRLGLLADFIEQQQDLTIRLDGYADPRGDADYNRQLSALRVKAVAEQLLQAGLSAERISQFSHGADFSKAGSGDLDAYALERLVRIQLVNSSDKQSVAQLDVIQ